MASQTRNVVIGCAPPTADQIWWRHEWKRPLLAPRCLMQREATNNRTGKLWRPRCSPIIGKRSPGLEQVHTGTFCSRPSDGWAWSRVKAKAMKQVSSGEIGASSLILFHGHSITGPLYFVLQWVRVGHILYGSWTVEPKFNTQHSIYIVVYHKTFYP